MKKLAIRRTLAAGAVLVAGLVPSATAGASAYGGYGGTNISTSNSLDANVNAQKANANSSSNVTYFNKTVNYEALSYVKYNASVTAFTASKQNAFNEASLNASLSKSANSEFNMPSYMSNYYN
ncbi:MAG TPA: hypothetical protein VLG47_01710 [Candidatus Saccharimonadales bacterium]|nr:hypothetical protein [Candidatus Saccharimonadales bacterium]